MLWTDKGSPMPSNGSISRQPCALQPLFVRAKNHPIVLMNLFCSLFRPRIICLYKTFDSKNWFGFSTVNLGCLFGELSDDQATAVPGKLSVGRVDCLFPSIVIFIPISSDWRRLLLFVQVFLLTLLLMLKCSYYINKRNIINCFFKSLFIFLNVVHRTGFVQ